MAKVKVWESKVYMYKLYVVERKTEQQIAAITGASQPTINRWLVRHGLKRK